jgi:hypothetical protein
MPRDGSVGSETFEQVESLVKQGKSKTEAFAQIASVPVPGGDRSLARVVGSEQWQPSVPPITLF